MLSTTKRQLSWLAIPLALGMFAAACGGDDDDDSSSGDDSGSEEITGSVNVSGSSTVEPISALVGEEFSLENPDVTVAVEGPGTGDGFEAFCAGDTDISDASRPIDEDEIAACEASGIEYVELQIGYDGLTVMTNANNEAVECLSFADLYSLIGPESEGFANWTDASALASQLGSTTQFPEGELALTGPGQESGTYDSFIELALADIAEERGLPEEEIETTRPDYDASDNDNVIVENIAASDTSLGWVGFAFAEGAGDAVREIEVSAEPGGECVAPDAETIASGDYPLSRSLYIYVNTANAADNPAVAAYVDFYLSDLATWVDESGYVSLPEDVASETQAAWDERA